MIIMTIIKFGLGTGGDPAPILIGTIVGAFALKTIARIQNWQPAYSESIVVVIIRNSTINS